MVRTPCVHLFVCFWKQIQEPCPRKGFLWDRLAKLLRKWAVKWNCWHSHLGRCVTCIKSISINPMVMGDCHKISMVLIFRPQHLARLNLSAKWDVSIQLRKHSNRNIHQKNDAILSPSNGISYNFFGEVKLEAAWKPRRDKNMKSSNFKTSTDSRSQETPLLNFTIKVYQNIIVYFKSTHGWY